jgi:hypothetical protein
MTSLQAALLNRALDLRTLFYNMATILELANFAGVSAENVLRVIHDEPVSEEVAARVAGAIEALGPPPSARPTPEVLPAETNGTALARKHEELLER